VAAGEVEFPQGGGPDEAALDGLQASLLEMQQLLVETRTFVEFLQELTNLAARSFPEDVACSVTLGAGRRVETTASSEELARLADQEQYSADVGPCLTAMREVTDVVVVDLPAESRFGDYPQRAAPLGIRSIVALPLRTSETAFGAMNLYSLEPGVFTDGSLVRARALAAAASGGVEISRRMTEQAELNEDLKSALASRRVIDQAIGIVMAQEACDADAAFGVLRRRSQNEHRKLREVAVELVTKTGGVPPAEGPVFAPGRRRPVADRP
jgi:GAF domain-containing protein